MVNVLQRDGLDYDLKRDDEGRPLEAVLKEEIRQRFPAGLHPQKVSLSYKNGKLTEINLESSYRGLFTPNRILFSYEGEKLIGIESQSKSDSRENLSKYIAKIFYRNGSISKVVTFLQLEPNNIILPSHLDLFSIYDKFKSTILLSYGLWPSDISAGLKEENFGSEENVELTAYLSLVLMFRTRTGDIPTMRLNPPNQILEESTPREIETGNIDIFLRNIRPKEEFFCAGYEGKNRFGDNNELVRIGPYSNLFPEDFFPKEFDEFELELTFANFKKLLSQK